MNDIAEDCQPSTALQILMIDDNQDFAAVMCELIEMLGYKTILATKGLEGIAKARQFHPDVIICDIGLPEMNGYDIAKTIRNDDELKDLFLIALSGYASHKDLERAMEAGFDRHLSKPVDINTIDTILSEFNENKSARKCPR